VPFEALAAGSRVEFGDEPDEHPRAVNVRLAEGEVPSPGNEPLPPEKLDTWHGVALRQAEQMRPSLPFGTLPS